MSFLTGALSGAVVAGGIYYAFSSTIKSQTNEHRSRMHKLSRALSAPSSAAVDAPPPAAARITQRPVLSLFSESWNRQVEAVYQTVYGWEKAISEKARKRLYGIDS